MYTCSPVGYNLITITQSGVRTQLHTEYGYFARHFAYYRQFAYILDSRLLHISHTVTVRISYGCRINSDHAILAVHCITDTVSVHELYYVKSNMQTVFIVGEMSCYTSTHRCAAIACRLHVDAPSLIGNTLLGARCYVSPLLMQLRHTLALPLA